MNIELINDRQIINYVMVICRVIAMILFLPGMLYVPSRIKILISIFISIIIAPLVIDNFKYEMNFGGIIFFSMREVLIGLFLGCVINILCNTINISANLISAQIGLSSVINFDQNIGEQNVILGSFFYIVFLICAFVTNSHLLIISALVESYNLITLDAGDFLTAILYAITYSFIIGIKISAILLVIGTLSYLVICVLGRLIPQIQFFFIAMPLQIWLGLIFVSVVLYGTLDWFNYIKMGIVNVINNFEIKF